MKALEKLVTVTTRHPVITILIVLVITSLAVISASGFAFDAVRS